MRANFENIGLEIFGESHADRIGMRLWGIPVGTRLSLRHVYDLLARRRATNAIWSTPRVEQDEPVFAGLSEEAGAYVVDGDAIEAYIQNKNVKSADYDKTAQIPRPSHADLAVWAKQGYIPAGGGRFSGRMTAPLCVAGGIAKELLEKRGIFVDSYLSEVAGIRLGSAYDSSICNEGMSERDRAAIKAAPLPAIDSANAELAKSKLADIAAQKDSAGGVIECVISGLKAGEIGDALFDGVEGKLAYSLYAIPAVKGVEFGKGFELARMTGSVANDPIGVKSGKPTPLSNASGGINGGISNGMPIILRVAIRPTPSIAAEQRSVDLGTGRETTLEIKGRHDVCIAPRAVPAVEAACALAIYDMLAAK